MNPKKSFLVVKIFFLLIIALLFIFIDRGEAKRDVQPRSMDPGTILKSETSFTRFGDFEIFRWNKLESVLIFDTLNYNVQSQFFKKLAFFIEKANYAGILHTDEELKWKHGYRAHNYSAEYLALYFNTAAMDSLNEKEQLLLEILLNNHILLLDEEEYLPVQGGVISISRESNYILRSYLMIHEMLHGFYYYFPSYRRGVETIWMETSEMEKEFWHLFLHSYNYNVDNPEIVVNEFHAYLLQQMESNINLRLYPSMLERIKSRRPDKSKFARDFPKNCPNCLINSARKVKELMIRVGEVAGFDYYSYFESLKLL